MKRLLLVSAIGIISAIVALQFKTVTNFYNDIYPRDTSRREALKLCILEDPSFNRFDSHARDNCYLHAGTQPTLAVEPAATGTAPNPVDMRQSAGRGNTPRNDVRTIQGTQGAVR